MHIAIEVSREKETDSSVDKCSPESGRVSFESTGQGELNGIGIGVSVCL